MNKFINLALFALLAAGITTQSNAASPTLTSTQLNQQLSALLINGLSGWEDNQSQLTSAQLQAIETGSIIAKIPMTQLSNQELNVTLFNILQNVCSYDNATTISNCTTFNNVVKPLYNTSNPTATQQAQLNNILNQLFTNQNTLLSWLNDTPRTPPNQQDLIALGNGLFTLSLTKRINIANEDMINLLADICNPQAAGNLALKSSNCNTFINQIAPAV